MSGGLAGGFFATSHQGSPEWLFSCSLYMPCWISACFTYTLFTWLTFLYACLPQAPTRDCSCPRGSEGRACPSARFPGIRWANLLSIPPVTGSLPLPGAKAASLSCSPSHGRCCSRTLLHICKMDPPYPLYHWCLCRWLHALSSVLKLGKYRPYRPVRCSPTERKRKMENLNNTRRESSFVLSLVGLNQDQSLNPHENSGKWYDLLKPLSPACKMGIIRPALQSCEDLVGLTPLKAQLRVQHVVSAGGIQMKHETVVLFLGTYLWGSVETFCKFIDKYWFYLAG